MKKVDTIDDAKAAGRPRDARTTRRILDAALELGLELGFDGLTGSSGVAARAGVGKTTIYQALARHLVCSSWMRCSTK